MTKRKPKKIGRKPIILTAARTKRFLDAISQGCPVKDACGVAGFSEAWYYIKKAEALENPEAKSSEVFLKFIESIKEAEGEATNRWLAMIEEAAKGGVWTAAAWKLERTRGMAQRVKTEGELNVTANVTVESSRERLLDKLACLASRIDADGDG